MTIEGLSGVLPMEGKVPGRLQLEVRSALGDVCLNHCFFASIRNYQMT